MKRRTKAAGGRILKRAREVLKIEAQAVADQIPHVDRTFAAAVEVLHKTSRAGAQVVVTGVGKSGLVGRKIAATLASTGTPAVFFHPAEGMHGDLGMVRPGDALLILSASGETEEIKKILPALRNRGLTLVAMTSNRRSRLARSADCVICSAVRKEACPLNLAPTASTTAMLALGDALAVSLMEKKGFQAADFARLHPGGALGKRLTLTVNDLMHKGRENAAVKKGSTVREALLEMTRTRLGATNVVDGRGRLIGFFTDGDLRRKLQEEPRLLDQAIEQVMTRAPRTIRAGESAHAALLLLRSRGFDNLPVVDGRGRSLGILDERDLLAEGIA